MQKPFGKWFGKRRERVKMKESKKKAFIFFKAFLTAFAFCTVFHAPLGASNYETGIDFVTASIYELLGNYDFTFLLLFGVLAFFYGRMEKTQNKSNKLLAVFFAFCLLLGRSYNEAGNWSYCFGSPVNFLKFLLALAGYALFFWQCMGIVTEKMELGNFVSEKPHFFSKKPFLKSFGILLLAYSPVIILSYPGNLCWDVIGQIEQVIFQTGYSAHHPLLHTLLAGGLTKLGSVVFGSYEAGLFLYIWVQTIMLAAAMAATIVVLAKRKADFKVLLCILLLYIVTPIYSNLTSTAIKDVPFAAAVLGYLICYALLLETPQLIKRRKFVLGFVGLQIAVILLRNNGLPLVLLSGLGGFLISHKKYNLREKIQSLITFFGAAVIIGSLCSMLLLQVCNGVSGSKGEMLSIFFQQTARYLQLYKTELQVEEKQAIEAVLGDVNEVAARYDPDISDPVKALFKKDASTAELVDYLRVWLKGFFKHPAVYFEAFLAHVYGLFSPAIANEIRYETQYDAIGQGLLFPQADKILIFLYRYANRISFLGILENVGAATWGLFFFTNLQRKKSSSMAAATLPLWFSLLICMASPCFFGHPRYALPILMGLPFLYGFSLSKAKENQDEGQPEEIEKRGTETCKSSLQKKTLS